MNKINVVIIDDEPKSISTLKILFHKYCEDVNILQTADSISNGIKVIETFENEIDILFLDIHLSDGDGFSLLEKLGKINFKIIFTTAYNQYALKAIKFSALDYLLKPIDTSELIESIEKYKNAGFNKNHNIEIESFKHALKHKSLFDKLAVPTMKEIVFIDLSKIQYLQSDNNYTTIVLDDKQEFISSKNIGYYEEILVSNNFYRIHNSYLVNLLKVVRYLRGKNGMIELDGGATLEVSARRKEELFKILNFNG